MGGSPPEAERGDLRTGCELSPAPDSPARILIVDQHEVFAQGIRLLLQDASDMEVVGISREVAEVPTGRPDFDVVILEDHSLESGSDVIENYTRLHPDVHFIMLAHCEDDERAVSEAFRIGCSGFIGRDRSVEDFLAAIRAARAGEILITASVFARLLPPVVRPSERGPTVLSMREREVLTVMAEGKADKEIADHFSLSLHTVRKHTQNIIRKLGAHSKLEAVIIAMKKGLISPM